MEQYFYRIPKIVTAVQIDFNNYQTLVQAVILCGKNKAVENIKKYIDEHIGIVDGEQYLVVQNWYTNTDNQIGAKQDDYVVMYTNPYNNERSIEVVDPLVFNQYCKKMSDIVKADTV